MPPFQQYSRINVQDLKAQMVKRVGPERASQYFDHFKGYISLRFNKTELDKLVVLTIGKENIGLHNQIIKAVLNNAIKSETPPQSSLVLDTSKPVKGVRRKPLLQFATSNDASIAGKSPTSVWENGNMCAESPRKERSGAFDQTISIDRHTGGKNSLVDLHRPFEHIEGAAEQSEADPSDGTVRLSKRPRIIVPPSSPDGNMGFSRVEQLSSSRTADSKHEEAHHQQWESGFVRAPFGTPFYGNNVGFTTKMPFIRLAGSFPQLPPVKGAEEEFVYSNDLPSTELLQRHMEYIAALEGLEGVNQDCVEIVNQGIDSFLKQLIGACIDLVKSRSGMQQGSQADRQVDSSSANLSSVKRVKQFSGAEPYSRKELMQEASLFQPTVSFLDFKLAMDLNPQQLGHDWPSQLEKIHLYSFDN